MGTGIKDILNRARDLATRSTMGELPLLTAGEQTKLSWAQLVESYEGVPEVYRDSLRTSPS